MTPSWQPVAARMVQLIAAAAVGAVLAISTTSSKAASPLSSLDIGFAQDMSVHHQQAITLADMVAADAAPRIRVLADQIRLAQLREIGMMTGWLQAAGAPMNAAIPMAWMPSQHGDHHAAGTGPEMQGMASFADLSRLQHLTGRDNEVLFLQLMIRHHLGGIQMAYFAAQHTGTMVVRQTATSMIDEQAQDVQLMTLLLQQRAAAPLPFP